jgi:hypothetical protein
MNLTRRALGAACAFSAVFTLDVGAAVAAGHPNHCINPAGVDLNELYATDDAFVTPFCTDAHTGDRWRPIERWVVAATFETIPPDFEPSAATPRDDYLAKLRSARYVVDAGTRRERSYTFAARHLLVATGDLPDGTQFVALTPRLSPLPPGPHTVDIYVTLAAETWDGLGLADENHQAAGTSLVGSVEFVVHRGRR